MHMFFQQDWLAIFLFTILWIFLAAVWYSPALFGRIYSQESGSKLVNQPNHWTKWIGIFLVAFLNLYGLEFFDRMTGSHTFLEGAANGFIAWLGFVATTHYQAVIWENSSVKNFAIHAGYKLIAFIVFSGLLAIW